MVYCTKYVCSTLPACRRGAHSPPAGRRPAFTPRWISGNNGVCCITRKRASHFSHLQIFCSNFKGRADQGQVSNSNYSFQILLVQESAWTLQGQTPIPLQQASSGLFHLKSIPFYTWQGSLNHHVQGPIVLYSRTLHTSSPVLSLGTELTKPLSKLL